MARVVVKKRLDAQLYRVSGERQLQEDQDAEDAFEGTPRECFERIDENKKMLPHDRGALDPVFVKTDRHK